MPKLRVGIVNFLNSKPLAWGFLKGHHADLFAPSFHPPAQVARMLSQGNLDVGLIPSIEVQRIPHLRVLPDLCIAARREVIGRHRRDRPIERPLGVSSLTPRLEDQARAERLGEQDGVARAGAALHPDEVGMHGADHGEAVLRLRVVDRMAARAAGIAFPDLCVDILRGAHVG